MFVSKFSSSYDVFGVMIESNLVAGNQDINKKPLQYGQSVTDKCVDFDETITMLEMLSDAVKARRAKNKPSSDAESQTSLF